MASQARGDTEAKASPGVAEKAFCDPPTHTSTPHASPSYGTAPRLEMPSTTRSTPASFVARPIASTSWMTPVEVSLCCVSTALAGASSNAALTSSGRTARPHS